MRNISNSSQGFTLLELLVTMGILLIVLTAAYQSYTRLLRGFVTESSSAEAQMEAVVNTNLLRLDIAHAGYGLAHDLNNRPIAWDNSSTPQRLTIRSTVNNLDEETLGWVMCNNSSMIQNNNNNSSLDTYVFLDRNEDYEVDGVSVCSALPSGTFLGYPYDDSPIPSGCSGQPCYNVIYELSATQTLDDCADGTRNLQRTVTNGTLWQPVINCVADWQVAFELDSNGDGLMDTLSTDISSLSVDERYAQIEQVHVYALVQEGSYERDFEFSGATSMDGISLDPSSVSEFSHYRWKMMKLSINPQDL